MTEKKNIYSDGHKIIILCSTHTNLQNAICFYLILIQAFKGLNDIAKVVRGSEFEDSRDEQIDIFDVKVNFFKEHPSSGVFQILQYNANSKPLKFIEEIK